MVGQHRVLGVVHCAHHRDGSDFLAEAGVRGARDEPAGELIEDELLGQTNQVAVGIEALRIQTDARSALVVARETGHGRHVGSGWQAKARLDDLGNRHDGNVGSIKNRHARRKRLIILRVAR